MLYSQFGYYITSKISQFQLKEEMKERILQDMPDSSLEAISFSINKDNIDWEEEGKEFSLNGEMYDVVRTRIVNGQTILYCSNDKKEEELLKKLNDFTRSSNQNEGKNGKPVNVKLVYDYIILDQASSIKLDLHPEHVYIHYAVALPQQTASITAPPPRA